jgi:glycosyltransferase involved in cell wall biosynthesis
VAAPAVVHVLEAVRGGTSRHLVDLVRAVPGWSHHVVVPPSDRVASTSGAVVDGAALLALAETGATVHRLDMRRSPLRPANAAAAAGLRRLLVRLGPDVVHGHSSVGGALARIAAAGTGVPAVYTPNGVAAGRAALAVERALGPLTAALIAVSESEAAMVRRTHLVSARRVRVVPNGIDLRPAPPDDRDLRSLVGVGPGVPLVGTVARLVAQKAPVDFVGVCAAVAERRPDVHFLLVGMGPLQPDVDAAVAAAGLGPRWHQIGHLPGAAGLLGQLDVFVLVSAFEGGPYTPLEAMHAGTPCVLSDVVGNADAVVDGVTGVLRPFGATAATGAAVVDLLADPARRDRMVADATARLHAVFDARLMGERVAAVYAEVAATRRRTRRLPRPAATSSAKSPEEQASTYSS